MAILSKKLLRFFPWPKPQAANKKGSRCALSWATGDKRKRPLNGVVAGQAETEQAAQPLCRSSRPPTCAVEGGHLRYGSFLLRPLTAEQLHALADPNPLRANSGMFSQP
jgi:hypothetical protein